MDPCSHKLLRDKDGPTEFIDWRGPASSTYSRVFHVAVVYWFRVQSTDFLGLPAPDFEGSVRLLPQPVTHASLCRATGCRKPGFAGMLVHLYSSC